MWYPNEENFKDFDSILAALTPSQYRRYHKMWRGKAPFKSASGLDAEKEKFIENYINEKLEDSVDRTCRNFFLNKMESDQNLADAVEQEIRQNINYYKRMAIDRGWCIIGLEDDYSLEDLNDPDAEDELVSCMMENCYLEGISYYDDFYDENSGVYKSKWRRLLREGALDSFNYRYRDNPRIGETRDISNLYSGFFGGKYRIYLDIDITAEDIGNDSEDGLHGNNLEFYLVTLSNMVRHYFEVLNKPEEVKGVRENFRYNAKEISRYYALGQYKSSVSGRVITIGKMLNTIRKKDPNYQTATGHSLDEIERIFNQRKTPFKGKICISRHPYDIAGMSTDRGWKSCMNLVDGGYKHYVESSLMNGGLIAYLIEENDDNITNPTSRLLIKPFVKKGERMNFDHPNWILCASKRYGTSYNKFTKVVQEWLDKNWNDKIDTGKDSYVFNKDFYMEDSDEEEAGKLFQQESEIPFL